MEYELINHSFNISMTATGSSDDHDLDKLGRLVNLLAPAPIRVGQCGLGSDCGQLLMWVESQIGRRPIIKRQTSAQHWASHITGRREETGLDVIR